MTATAPAPTDEITDLDLGLTLEELDALLEGDVVNSVPPFINN